MNKRVRFWVFYRDDYVRLTLTPSRPRLEAGYGGRCDEGWSRSYTAWELDGPVVLREWCEDGADCDGRHSSEGEDVCPIDQLAAHEVPEWCGPAPRMPKWERRRSGQRDYSAEAAGY